jgi:hypothetical protein
MGKLHYETEDVSLSRLVSRAQLIARVTPAKPGSEMGTIANRSKKPFKVRRFCYQVEAVLKGEASLVGEVVKVNPPDWKTMLDLHEKYELFRMHKSPIIRQYTCIELMQGLKEPKGYGRCVLFLKKSPHPGVWDDCFPSFMASVEAEPKVRAALGSSPDKWDSDA